MARLLRRILRRVLSGARRKELAVRLLGDQFYLLKKDPAFQRQVDVETLLKSPPGKRPIQNVLATLPHVMPGYIAADWFWSDSYYPFYVKLAQALSPRSIVEIGSLQGFSLISMAEGAPDVRQLVWIDNEMYLPGSNQMCYENVRYFFGKFRAGSRLPEMKFYSSSWDALRLRENGPIDLIHIDGEHTFEGKLRDLTICSSLQPTYMILDDYFNVFNHKAIDYWAKCFRLDFFVIDTFSRGLAVFDFGKKKKALELVKKCGLPVAKTFSWKNADIV